MYVCPEETWRLWQRPRLLRLIKGYHFYPVKANVYLSITTIAATLATTTPSLQTRGPEVCHWNRLQVNLETSITSWEGTAQTNLAHCSASHTFPSVTKSHRETWGSFCRAKRPATLSTPATAMISCWAQLESGGSTCGAQTFTQNPKQKMATALTEIKWSGRKGLLKMETMKKLSWQQCRPQRKEMTKGMRVVTVSHL